MMVRGRLLLRLLSQFDCVRERRHCWGSLCDKAMPSQSKMAQESLEGRVACTESGAAGDD